MAAYLIDHPNLEDFNVVAAAMAAFNEQVLGEASVDSIEAWDDFNDQVTAAFDEDVCSLTHKNPEVLESWAEYWHMVAASNSNNYDAQGKRL